jgi:serine/threonine protein kinase
MKQFFTEVLDHLSFAKEIRHLGDGGFARVKLYECAQCAQCDCQQQFVVKEMSMDKIMCLNRIQFMNKYKHMRRMLVNEFLMLKSLNHPNIIKVADIDLDSNAIIFENFVGTDMLDYIEENQPADVCRYILQSFSSIVDGIEYMHSEGIAHLDIKLENMILDVESKTSKLIDFGHAKVFMSNGKRKTSSGIVGTRGYFPPEFFTKRTYAADKVDVWCCGIVLYNILFDSMPWESSYSFRDSHYSHCREFFDCKKLHPQLFDLDKTTISELTSDDKELIRKIFIGTFMTESEDRISIAKLNKMLKQVSVIQE